MMQIITFQHRLSPETLPYPLGEKGFSDALEAHLMNVLQAEKLIRYAIVAIETTPEATAPTTTTWLIEGAYQRSKR
jgi:hypothetical protein